MLQLYFLSILCNGIAGFLFVYGDAFESGSAEGSLKSPSFSGSFQLIVGIVAVITGLLKLLSPVRVPILGDLLPAVAGIVSGFMLVYGFYRNRGSGVEGEGKIDHFGDILLRHKKPIGIACIAVAVLHFLFPYALFL